MLIAHHCATPRLWQALEIDLLKELATQLGIALRQAELYQQSQAELAERNQVEAALRESEERLRSALEASRMGTWDWNIQTGQIQWSDNLEAMFGLEPGTFDGSFEMFTSFLHPDDLDRVLVTIERAISTGEDYNIEFRVVYPNGSVRWALSQGKVFYDLNGQPIRMAGNDIDITERKRAEISLRESEQRSAVLSQISPVGIFRTDMHGDCLYTNTRWCELAGLTPEDALGKGWLRALHPDDRDRVLADWYRAIELNVSFYSEYRFQAADAKVSWVLGQVTAERNSEGNLLGYVGTVTDISDLKQAEKALQESESRFRQLAENIDAVFWIKEVTEDRVSYVSPAYERLWGLNPQDLYESQQAWINYIHPDDRELVDRAFQAKAADGLFDEEYRIILPNGQVRWVHDRCFPLQDAAGVLHRFTGIAEDITNRKQIEERLRLQAQVLDQTHDSVISTDLDGNITSWNKGAERVLGYTAEEVLGQPVAMLYPSDQQEFLQRQVIEPLKANGEHEVEVSIRRKSGESLDLLLSLSLLRNENQQPIGMIGFSMDITDRIQAEKALRQSEDRFRTLADNMSQFAWMAHADGDIFWYNQRWFNYTGTTLEEMQGWGWQKVHHPDHVDRVVHHIRHCFETGQLWEDTFPLRGQDGQYRWFLSRAIPIRNEQGEITCWFGTNTDITDRKQSEMERDRLLAQEQAARESAERANRIKDEFLAVLSHELRSPLNPILGWTKLMQSRKFDTAETSEALATIERNAKLQTQLIDDLLDVAKILRGKLIMNEAPIDLAFVIEAAIDTVRAAAVAKNITLHAVLPQIGRVSGDAARLQQIVWNLLSNAVKFTPTQGRVEIRLEREGNQVKIIVSDTGKGINPDFLPHIFESFRQEDASTTRQYGGLGLGLAIVRYLIEAHGGTIYADSLGEGHGATFIVQLPLLDVETELPPSKEVSENELDLTGIRILAIDDELDARELLTALLTQYGAEVLSVTLATEVLTHLESFQPDVLISDIGMPGVDGYMLMQQVRALPPEKGGRILAIALTAYAREEDYQQAIACGYQRHLTKPLDLDLLVQVVVELTRH